MTDTVSTDPGRQPTGLRAPYSISAVDRVDELGEFACEEARAALMWSRSRAQRHMLFALGVFSRLPLLGEAMLAGELDEPRARAFIDWTEGLSDEQAHQVCQTLLPVAAKLTVGELIDRIKRLCLAIDPDWAAHRYREAVRRRTVRGSRNPDGTANLAGYNQPVDRVVAAAGRIDALARACKRAGDGRPADHIRSDLYLGMTDGTFEALTEAQIVEHVLVNPYTMPPPAQGHLNLDPDNGDDGSDGDGDTGYSNDDHDDGASGPDPSRGTGADGMGAGGSLGRASALAGVSAGSGRWSVPDIRIRLSTLLGRDEYPAEIPGWDYVPAWLARHRLRYLRKTHRRSRQARPFDADPGEVATRATSHGLSACNDGHGCRGRTTSQISPGSSAGSRSPRWD